MDLQVVSSLSELPLLNGSYNKACEYYTGVKKQYRLADSLLSTVESNVSKAASMAAPYLERYQPQIQKVDQLANERVVKKLIGYCNPIVTKTPDELSVETKHRVNAAVESVRHRAIRTRSQIYAAPSETVKMGRDMIATRYQSAVELAGEKARKLRTDVPAMLPSRARQYVESLLTQFGVQQRYEQLWQAASSAVDRAKQTYTESKQRIPGSLNELSANYIAPVRSRVEPYWTQTSQSFHATSGLIYDSYNRLKASRLAAISTAREMLDSLVGAVWEYSSDLTKELSETYSTGSSGELARLAGRRLRTGRDVVTQLTRWTYGELVALQDASTSVLDVILSSWLFHWLTFQPVMDRLPEATAHETEQPTPASTEQLDEPVAHEEAPKLQESFGDDSESDDADEEDEEED